MDRSVNYECEYGKCDIGISTDRDKDAKTNIHIRFSYFVLFPMNFGIRLINFFTEQKWTPKTIRKQGAENGAGSCIVILWLFDGRFEDSSRIRYNNIAQFVSDMTKASETVLLFSTRRYWMV